MDLVSGELEALRAALVAEVDLAAFQRVEIGDFLELRWDSRKHRQQVLERLIDSDTDSVAAMVASLDRRNRKKLALWPSARRTLGERADKRVFLIADPTGLHVQFARIGWDEVGKRGLAYFELRPRGGSESMRAVVRIVRRTATGWSVEPGRWSVDRGDFARQIGDPADRPRP